MSTAVDVAHARLASLRRHRPPGHPDIAQAATLLKSAVAVSTIERLIASGLPLEDRTRLAVRLLTSESDR